MEIRRNIQLYLGPTEPCPYLDETNSRNVFADPKISYEPQEQDSLLRQGFRRSGNLWYRPHCPSCESCRAIRIPVATFSANRNQRRCLRNHGHLQSNARPVEWIDEHYQLFQTYQAARHAGGVMHSDDPGLYRSLIEGNTSGAVLVDFRNAEGELKMVSLIDQTPRGLSAVYAFFNPNDAASYGRYNILWQIQQAQRLQLPHVYLGYWIAQCRKMSYKTEYRDHELYDWDTGTWAVA